MKNEPEIVRVLSPSIQVRLLELQKREWGLEVLFVNDTMLFSFSGKLLKNMRSNFFKKVEIHSADIDAVQNRLREVFLLGIDMARFLD